MLRVCGGYFAAGILVCARDPTRENRWAVLLGRERRTQMGRRVAVLGNLGGLRSRSDGGRAALTAQREVAEETCGVYDLTLDADADPCVESGNGYMLFMRRTFWVSPSELAEARDGVSHAHWLEVDGFEWILIPDLLEMADAQDASTHAPKGDGTTPLYQPLCTLLARSAEARRILLDIDRDPSRQVRE